MSKKWADDRRDVFPMPINELDGSTGVGGPRVRARERKRRAVHDATQRALRSLNALARGQVADLSETSTLESKALNAGQSVVHRNVSESCDREFRRGLLLRADQWVSRKVNEQSGDYIVKQYRETKWMVSSKLSLPEDGVAGTVEMLGALPGEIAALYATPGEMLKAQRPDKAELKQTRSYMGVSPSEYTKVIKVLEQKGIIQLVQSRPEVINGMFAVPKRDKQRLIIDARRANLYFKDSPEIALPNPGNLVELCLDSEGKLYGGKSDMDNFYHRIRVPAWLQAYFGLPALQLRGQKVWPVLRVLPMGWSHSVYVGQMIHERIVRGISELGPGKMILAETSRLIDDVRIGIYIDDFFALGTELEKVQQSVLKVKEKCAETGFPVAENKLELPPKDGLEVLGIEIYLNGRMLPKQQKMADLLIETHQMIRAPKWAQRRLSEVLGKWVWFLLLRRPFLSILKSCYEILHSEKYCAVPTYEARCELATLTSVAPLIYGDMARSFADKIICIDASSRGAGVVYSTADKGDYRHLLHGGSISEWQRARNWKVAIKHRWQKEQHINILEGKALILGLRWFLRNTQNYGKRLIIGVDNQTLIGALEKGRSSLGLHHICRQVAALMVAGDIQLTLLYIPSEHNPADGPSRSV